jgi:hypothetical protein
MDLFTARCQCVIRTRWFGAIRSGLAAAKAGTLSPRKRGGVGFGPRLGEQSNVGFHHHPHQILE